MSILDRVAGALGYHRASAPPSPAPINDAAPTPLPAIVRGSEMFEVFAGQSAGALPALNEHTALTISAIYACVDLIGGAIASLPMQLFNKAADGERTELPDDSLWWLLNEEFHARWPASAGWEFMVLSRLLHGDAFAEIKRSGSEPSSLLPLHPLRVTPAPWLDGTRLAYVVEPDEWSADKSYRVLDQDDVLHVPGFGYNGVRSISPLRYALRQAGGVAKAAQDFSGQFFANSARPDYALRTEKPLSNEQVENLKAQIDEKHGRGNSHRPMVLQGGLDIKTISLPNEDMELIATRKFQIEEIARIYGIPPFMIGHNEKTTSWGSGVGEMGAGFVRYTLRKHLNAFHNEINRKFFRTGRKVAEFDTFELESADMTSLFASFRVALGRAGEPGFMSRNEVRKRLKLQKRPGGDALNDGASDAKPLAEPAGK